MAESGHLRAAALAGLVLACAAAAAGAPESGAQEGSGQVVQIATQTATVSDSHRAYKSGAAPSDAPAVSDSRSSLNNLLAGSSDSVSVSDSYRAYKSGIVAPDAPSLLHRTSSGGSFNQNVDDAPAAFDSVAAVIPASHTPVDARDVIAALDSAASRFAAAPEPPAPAAPRGGGGGGDRPVFGAVLQPGSSRDVYVRSASWDCNTGVFTVVAGPEPEYVDVTLRMPIAGLVRMAQSGEQSEYGVFTAPFGSAEYYARITATLVSIRAVSSDSESVDIDSCTGTRTFDVPAPPSVTLPQPVQDQEPAALESAGAAAGQAADPEPPADEPAVERPEEREAPEPAAPAAEPQAPAGATPAMAEPEEDEPVCGPGTFLAADGTCAPVPAGDGGGCLIATAAYGTETAEQVQRLREIRDGVLSTGAGSAFVSAFNQFYYAFSPAVADMERSNPAFKEAVRLSLQPTLWSLGAMEFAESEAQAVLLGSLVILFNASLLGSPAAAALAYRRLSRARP